MAIEEDQEHVADRLMVAIGRLGAPVCVGIDPVVERLPEVLRPRSQSPANGVEAIGAFALGVLDAVAEVVPCVKLQSACFERYRHLGAEVLHRLTAEARARGLQVILDAKRGDISISARHYAAAAFDPWPVGPDTRPDWVTVNPYLGPDALRPFLCKGFGAFALVRTSNPESDAVQAQQLADGRTVAESVAAMVASVGEGSGGRSGFSSLGAVVAATKPKETAALRQLMPDQIFLVPGFGSQGAGLDEIRPCFQSGGRGAIVTASRSIIYAFDPGRADWARAVADAAETFAEEVGKAVGMR